MKPIRGWVHLRTPEEILETGLTESERAEILEEFEYLKDCTGDCDSDAADPALREACLAIRAIIEAYQPKPRVEVLEDANRIISILKEGLEDIAGMEHGYCSRLADKVLGEARGKAQGDGE